MEKASLLSSQESVVLDHCDLEYCCNFHTVILTGK